jgi:hypothetical protein
MSELILDVRLDGYEKQAGLLVRNDYGILSFYYHPEYLAGRAPINLSVSDSKVALASQMERFSRTGAQRTLST